MDRIFDAEYITSTCDAIKKVLQESKGYMEEMLAIASQAETAMEEVPSYAKDSSVYSAISALRSHIKEMDLDSVISKLDACRERAANLIPEADQSYAEETAELQENIGKIKDSLNQIGEFLVNTPLTVDYSTFLINLEVAKAKCEELTDDANQAIEKILANIKGAETVSQIFSKDPVNLSTGNFIYDRTDLEIQGRELFSFRRFYNARNTRSGVMGQDWNHNYELFLERKGQELVLIKEDGKEERFIKTSTGLWASLFHSDGTLTETEEGFRYETRNQYVYEFDLEGYYLRKKHREEVLVELVYEDISGLTEEERKSSYPGKRRVLKRVTDSSGNQFEFAYQEGGYLSSVTDQTGRCAAYRYRNKTLQEVLLPDGNSFWYEYSPQGKLQGVTNPRGIQTVENIFDEQNRTVLQRFPDGGSMSYVYDDENRTVELTERNGSKVTYVHDKQYRDIRHIYENGEERFEYNQRNQKTLAVDRSGNKTQFAYDTEGYLTRIIDPLGNKTELIYDSSTHQPKEIRVNGKTKAKGNYDECGNLICLTDALGQEVRFEYNSENLPERIQQADESIIKLAYDQRGNVTAVTDAMENTTKYRYDALNRMVESVDGNGHTTRYTYDVMGNLTRLENAEGHIRTFVYNESGKVTEITDFDGKTEKREYNVLNRPSKVIDKEGRETLLTYDSMWNLARITEPNGAKTTYIYNQENLLGRIKYADGATVRYTYDANGNRISEEDENGGQTSFGYDALGRVTEVKGEEGLHYRYAYDGEGNLISVEDALGNVVQMEYDSAGNLLKETNPLGESRSYTYTSLGDLESVTDEAGRITRYRYYPGGLLEKIQNPDGTEESYTYDATGNVRTHTYATGFVISYLYDCMGRITEIQGNNGEKKNYTYDALGNVTSMTDGNGNMTRYEYTYSGQLKKVIDAFGNETEYSYDLCDRLIEIRQYGADGSLLTQQEETGQENLSTWCLDPELLEAEKQNGRNRICQVTRYTRDLRGRVTGITDALGQKEAYTYDPKGQLLSKLDKEGYLTKYVYTKQGDVSGIQYADGREVKMSYNPLRQLMEVQDWIGLTKIQNDALGRAVKVTYPDKKEVAYTYGKAGERRSMTYPDGRTVYYGYDEQLRLSELKEGDSIITYGYDSFGRLKEKNFPNGMKTTYAYDEKSQLRELLHTDKEGILDHYTYEYDLLGNKTGITKERRNLEEESGAYTYGYDALERLSSIHKDGIRQTRYTYDAFGNRTGKEEQGTQIRYRYNSLNQLVSQTDQNADGSVSRESYRYDRRGNLSQILKDGQVKNQYVYGAINRLEQAVNGSGAKANYLYNGLGHRVGKEIILDPTKQLSGQSQKPDSRIDYLIDLTREYHNLLEKTEDGISQTYFWDGNVAAFEESGKRSYYLQDELGSPLRIEDELGLTRETYGYGAFGEDLYGNQGVLQVFGYTGYQRDNVAGTYYAQAREYQAEVGRFAGQDLIAGFMDMPLSMNRYSYCFNMPMILVDLGGAWPSWSDIAKVSLTTVAIVGIAAISISTGGLAGAVLMGVASGAAIGGTVNGIINVKNSGSFANGFVGGAVSGGVQGGLGVAYGPGGTILGGVANGAGTFITEFMDSIDGYNYKNLKQIGGDSAKASLLGIICSIPGGLIQAGTSKANKEILEELMANYTEAFGNNLTQFYGILDNFFLDIVMEECDNE